MNLLALYAALPLVYATSDDTLSQATKVLQSMGHIYHDLSTYYVAHKSDSTLYMGVSSYMQEMADVLSAQSNPAFDKAYDYVTGQIASVTDNSAAAYAVTAQTTVFVKNAAPSASYDILAVVFGLLL